MLRERGIVGYADRLSVQPGETIRFMVSSEAPQYRADIVRLIHGDANPNGPGFKETLVDTPANGDYAGRRQELPFGSYVVVPDDPALRLAGSFTVTAWIAPTTPGVSFGKRTAQGIVTQWSADAPGGYGVEEGRLAAGRTTRWPTGTSRPTSSRKRSATARPADCTGGRSTPPPAR